MSRYHIDLINAIEGGLAVAHYRLERAMNTAKRSDEWEDIRTDRYKIEEAKKAMERLQRDLRDGRKHVADPPDRPETDVLKAVNREVADEGHAICDACAGMGVGMTVVNYGTGPVERTIECPDCENEGQIKL